MIELTRFNGASVWVNPDLLQYVEANPDTRITLTTGTKLVVLEEPGVIVQRVALYRRSLLQDQLSPEAAFKLLQRSEDA